MARGQRDFGAYAATTVMAGLSDMAELAARLGSIVLFDRFGRVAHLDDFEGTVLKWEVTVAGGGAVVLDSTDPKSGSQDVRLSLANIPISQATIVKGFIPLLSNRIGCEISFTRPDTNTFLDIVAWFFTGTQGRVGQVRLDFNAGTLAYLNGVPAYVNFATGLNITTNNFIYHPAKLVVDFDTSRYVEFLYGPTVYDLSAFPLWTFASAIAPQIYISFELRARIDAVSSIYLDDFILTQDEP